MILPLGNKNNQFVLYFARLIVSFDKRGIASGEKINLKFILFSSRLALSLDKILPLGNKNNQVCFVFRSLNRIFVN